jgi:hypothetical protein
MADYRGYSGSPISSAVGSAGDDFLRGLLERRRRQDEAEKAAGEARGAQATADLLYKNKIWDAEQYQKFNQAPLKQKAAMVGTLVNNYHLSLLQNEENRRAAEAAWTPPPEAQTAATWSNKQYLPQGPGKYGLVDYTATTQPPTEQQQREASYTGGRIIWDGEKYSYHQYPTTDVTGPPTKDPQTGLWLQDGKPLPEPIQQRIEDLQAERAKAAQPQPTPQPGYLSNVYHAIFGGGTPAATPTPVPSETPATTQMQLAPGAGNAITQRDQDALKWARENPDDPRADAILAKLGITQ